LTVPMAVRATLANTNFTVPLSARLAVTETNSAGEVGRPGRHNRWRQPPTAPCQ
jgi:hypothetical protein